MMGLIITGVGFLFSLLLFPESDWYANICYLLSTGVCLFDLRRSAIKLQKKRIVNILTISVNIVFLCFNNL